MGEKIKDIMVHEAKKFLQEEAKKYLLIGAGIVFGCLLIGVAVVAAIAGDDSFNGGYISTNGSLGGSNVQLEGMNLYNSDGSVNQDAIQELEDYMTENYLGLEATGAVTHKDFSLVADWLQEGLIFQCPWWAVGRANYFLEQIGSDKRVEMDNGQDVITNSSNVANFTIGTEPRPNSLICWGGDQYGHIAYVEAVDTDGTIYFSEARSGESWNGINSCTKDSYDFLGLSFLGFLYLTDEEYVLNNSSTGGGANVDATLSADDIQNVDSMLTFAKSLEGNSLSGVKNHLTSNESSDYNGDWCSWFCWNMYYRYGFVKEGSWTGSYSRDTSLAYAAGWMYMDEDAYNGYIRSEKYGNTSYVPKAGDLVIYASEEYPLAAHIGMVTAVGDGKISTVEGNMSEMVKIYTWNITSNGSSKYIGQTDYFEIKGYYSLAQALANQN